MDKKIIVVIFLGIICGLIFISKQKKVNLSDNCPYCEKDEDCFCHCDTMWSKQALKECEAHGYGCLVACVIDPCFEMIDKEFNIRCIGNACVWE